MKNSFHFLLVLMLGWTLSACSGDQSKGKSSSANEPKVVKKFRDDGTLSSMNPVDEDDFVHGVKVNYYGDGRTIHSRVTYEHGVKNGPAIWYYKNGQIFEHTAFMDGRKHGVTKKYHDNGKLLSQCTFHNGDPKPGLVEYKKDGSKVSNHPTVEFKKLDRTASENTVYLEIRSSVRSSKARYFYKADLENHSQYRDYLDSDGGKATLDFYVAPGTSISRKIELYAELPTELGNILVRELSYQLNASN